ncbi:heme-binding beta-barrel domain-containing protein [Actinomyces sp. oral taxon 897]|uniref:FABP family protein n=1 Tax=Actinomyces sp. oral taxon 897 TaxID=2081702 RepID=UPI0026BA7D98
MAFTLPDDLAPEIYPLAWLVGTWRGYGILTYGQDVPEQAVYQEMTFDHDGGPYLRQTTTIWTVDATRSRDLDFETPGLQGACLLAPAQIWSTETTYWRAVGQEQPAAAQGEEERPAPAQGAALPADGPRPAAPGKPTEPAAPTGSTMSAAPAEPTVPTGPAGSVETTEPAGTTVPAKPVGPTESAEPAGSTRTPGPADSDDAPEGTRTGPLIPVTALELVSADPAGHVAVWEGWIRGPRAQVGTQAVGRTRTSAPVTEMTRMFGLVGGDLMWTQDMAAFGVQELRTYASGRLGRVEDPEDPATRPGSALPPLPATAPGASAPDASGTRTSGTGASRPLSADAVAGPTEGGDASAPSATPTTPAGTPTKAPDAQAGAPEAPAAR